MEYVQFPQRLMKAMQNIFESWSSAKGFPIVHRCIVRLHWLHMRFRHLVFVNRGRGRDRYAYLCRNQRAVQIGTGH